MFKRKRKYAEINIKNTDENIYFDVSWDKGNEEQLGVFVKLLLMLYTNNIMQYLERAIIQYGEKTNDQDTAKNIIISLKSFYDNVAYKDIEQKYMQEVLKRKNIRDPLIKPDEVFSKFKKNINE